MIESAPRNTIELDRVTTSRGRFPVLSSLTLSVREGQFMDLYGATGSGKTTVLRVVSGLVAPTSGRVVVSGRDLLSMSRGALRRFRRTLGFMARDLLPPDDETLVDAVSVPAVLAGNSLRAARRMASEAVAICGLSAMRYNRMGDLSEGERQLACLAQAIVHRPLIILADEPTAHLDNARARSVLELLSRYASQGGTILAVSLHPLPGGYATAVDMERLQRV